MRLSGDMIFKSSMSRLLLRDSGQKGALEIPCHFCKLKKRNDTCEKNLILM